MQPLEVQNLTSGQGGGVAASPGWCWGVPELRKHFQLLCFVCNPVGFSFSFL